MECSSPINQRESSCRPEGTFTLQVELSLRPLRTCQAEVDPTWRCNSLRAKRCQLTAAHLMYRQSLVTRSETHSSSVALCFLSSSNSQRFMTSNAYSLSPKSSRELQASDANSEPMMIVRNRRLRTRSRASKKTSRHRVSHLRIKASETINQLTRFSHAQTQSGTST